MLVNKMMVYVMIGLAVIQVRIPPLQGAFAPYYLSLYNTTAFHIVGDSLPDCDGPELERYGELFGRHAE